MEAYYHALVRGDKRGGKAAVERGLLWAATFPYGWIVQLRNLLFDLSWKPIHRAAIPVISVGNLTLGGTGKTPCVELVAHFLRQHDFRVAILSRGFGAKQSTNDEYLVLEENLPDVPHLQDRDRVRLATIAVEELDSEVLILDDGFQHRRLYRNLDVVLVDATAPWGYDHLFPRGLLREPRRNLRRAGLIVLTRCDQVEPAHLEQLRQQINQLAPDVPVIETMHQPTEWLQSDGSRKPIQSSESLRVAAFCGIGNPAAFRRTLESIGCEVVEFRIFPDHHNYSREDIEELRRWAQHLPGDCVLVTTQKDLVKLRINQLGGHELWALRIQLTISSGREAFERSLLDVVSSH